MRITSRLENYEHGYAHIGVKVEGNIIDENIKPAHYLAILRSLRDTDKDAFYAAMSEFVDNDEFQNALDWFSEHGCEGCEGCDNDE